MNFLLWGLKFVERHYEICLAPRILKWCLGFWKFFDTASLIVMFSVSIYLNTLFQMVLLRGTKQQHVLYS